MAKSSECVGREKSGKFHLSVQCVELWAHIPHIDTGWLKGRGSNAHPPTHRWSKQPVRSFLSRPAKSNPVHYVPIVLSVWERTSENAIDRSNRGPQNWGATCLLFTSLRIRSQRFWTHKNSKANWNGKGFFLIRSVHLSGHFLRPFAHYSRRWLNFYFALARQRDTHNWIEAAFIISIYIWFCELTSTFHSVESSAPFPSN